MPARGGVTRRAALAGLGAVGVSALAGGVGSAADGRRAATVIKNARLWTGRGPTAADAVAIGRGGRIIAVGTSAELLALVGRDTEVIDADGGTVMPGIHDMHVHPLGAADRLLTYSLQNATVTVDQLLSRLKKFLADSLDQEPDGWLVVSDWNPAGLKGAVAHRRFLDRLDTKRPIQLAGSDAHNSWVNTRALKLAGIDASTPSPPGGEIVQDADGPTGLLKDTAQDLVTKVIPSPSDEDLRAARARAFAEMSANGITTFMDAASSGKSIDRYAELMDAGLLGQRVYTAFEVSNDLFEDPQAVIDAAGKAAGRIPDGARLRMQTLKVFVDGVAEYPSQTAAMLRPYLDEDGHPTDNYGDLYITRSQLGDIAVASHQAGWQVHAHAIGDRAVRVALDAFEQAHRSGPHHDARHTIAHIQFCDPHDWYRFSRDRVVASMQLQWALRDVWTLESLRPYVGAERHRTMYPAESIRANGGRLAGGSDWPVDPLDPWNQIQTAIDRKGSEQPDQPLHREQAISREVSLRMHTHGAAYQAQQDRHTGSIEVGKQADLVVLDRDIEAVEVSEISRTKVHYTFVGGDVIHDHQTASGRRAMATIEDERNGVAPAFPVPVNRHDGCGGGCSGE